MTDFSYPLSYLEKGEREIVRERERGREREREEEMWGQQVHLHVVSDRFK